MLYKCRVCGTINQVPPYYKHIPPPFLRCGQCNIGTLEPYKPPPPNPVASSILGAGLGAAFGSIFPGVGTWAGGLIGGAVGAWWANQQGAGKKP